MSDELEREIMDGSSTEEELIARVRSAYGLSENSAIEHIGFVRDGRQDDTIQIGARAGG